MITWTNANSSKGLKIIEKPSSNIVEIECGMKVKGTVILDKNLNCSGDVLHALHVKDNDVIIYLNGHTISGPGKYLTDRDGIFLDNSLKNISIYGPGKITDYRWGIFFIDNQNNITIQSVNFEENWHAISITGNGIKIHDNTFENNVVGVFHNKGQDNTIKNNNFDNSEQLGIGLLDFVNSTIENNGITSSIVGIGLSKDSTNNVIVSNNLKDNEVDINYGDGLYPEENNNQFSNNACEKSVPKSICD